MEILCLNFDPWWLRSYKGKAKLDYFDTAGVTTILCYQSAHFYRFTLGFTKTANKIKKIKHQITAYSLKDGCQKQ